MHAVWFNGDFRNPENFSIQVNDLGLLRGYGLFDYFRTYNRRPFQWDWYWDRFVNSARIMRLEIPLKKEEALSVIQELISRSPGEVAIRMLLTGGFSENSIDAPHSNLFLLSEPLRETPQKKYEEGLQIETRAYMRDLPEVKTTDYKYLLLEKKDSQTDDFLYVHNGYLYELSRSNVFLVKNKVLITPKAGILHGISRKLVLQLAKERYGIEERPVKVEELFTADEVFTTSSTKQVLGITYIDNKPVQNGTPGELTRTLKDLFQRFIDQHYF